MNKIRNNKIFVTDEEEVVHNLGVVNDNTYKKTV